MESPESTAVATLACPSCGGDRYREIKRFHSPPVVVGECLSCGLLYTPHRHLMPEDLLAGASLAELRMLYRPILEGRARHFREKNFKEYLDVIERHTPGRSLLDVGCAHGLFLARARARGWRVVGVEPSRPMASFAAESLGLDVRVGRLDQVDLGPCRFDAISLTDSAEYLLTPVKDLTPLAQRLQPGGIVFIKVPNGDYFRLRHRVESRLGIHIGEEAFSPSQRVAHYTLATLRVLGERLGLEIVAVRSCRPVDSPVWWRLTGIWLEIEAPWYLGLPAKLLRRVLHVVGRVEEAATGTNHFSPAIYLLARRRATTSS